MRDKVTDAVGLVNRIRVIHALQGSTYLFLKQHVGLIGKRYDVTSLLMMDFPQDIQALSSNTSMFGRCGWTFSYRGREGLRRVGENIPACRSGVDGDDFHDNQYTRLGSDFQSLGLHSCICQGYRLAFVIRICRKCRKP